MKNKHTGFTLAELLMVVVILGILSAVALPRFAPQKEKAYASEAVGMLSAIRQLEEAYRLENGTYCDPNGGANPCGAAGADGWSDLGMTVSPNNLFWNYTVVAGAATFTATATRLSNRWSGSAAYPVAPAPGPSVTLDQAGVYGGTHPNVPA